MSNVNSNCSGGTNSCSGGKNCVCKVVRTINDNQDNVVSEHCDISCNQSIQDLVSPSTSGNGLDTVPFILYTKKGEPFRGYGTEIFSSGGTPTFNCVDSFIFRVSDIDEDSCCAVVELLQFNGDDNAGDTVCNQLDNEPVGDLERTRICITVDLSCFCAITCLPAVSVM